MQIAAHNPVSARLRWLMQVLCVGLAVLLAPGCNKTEPPRGYGWFLEREGQGRVLLIPAMHVARNDFRTLPPFVETTILASEVLAIEYVVDSHDEAARERLTNCLGREQRASLGSEDLTSTTRDAVQRLLLDSGLPPPEHLRTVSDAQRLVGRAMLKVLGLRKEFGMDASLSIAARNFNKSIESLETECSAVRKSAEVEGIVSNAAVLALVDGITSGTFQSIWQKMEDGWALGDAGLGCLAVDQLLTSSPMDRDVFEAVVKGRNSELAEGITRRSANGRPVVAAVGLGHFCGPDSILAELAQRGFRATFRKG